MRAVVTECDIPQGGDLTVAAGTIITPSARDLARLRAVKIVEVPESDFKAVPPAGKVIVIGADHGGFQLKEALKPTIAELGLFIEDVGVHDENPVDYPDIAEKVCEALLQSKGKRGVIVDGAGIGSSMAANKMPGIRAALCYDRASARNSREHNDSNVLTLGGRLLTESQATDVLRTWLATPFAGGRHSGRVDKISQIERRYANWKPPN